MQNSSSNTVQKSKNKNNVKDIYFKTEIAFKFLFYNF